MSRRLRVRAGELSRHIGARALEAAGVFGIGLALALAVASTLPAPAAQAATGINKTISFQGKVTNSNGTNVTNGTYTFVFSLYTVASGGSNIWTETKSLTVTDGIFQTNLGSSTTLPGSVDFNTDNIYLGMSFNSDPEMSPRIQFTASPYAFNSEKLGGLTAAQFAQLSPGSAQSGFLNVTGNVTSGATVAATTSVQAPLVDTATAVALNVGTGTASSVTIGRTTTPFLVQGNSSSTFTATSGANTTTVGFVAPTGANAINFPNAGGTLCTTVASTCSATYQAAGTYLAKNAADTSSFGVTAANYLYGFSNSNATPTTGGVLSLSNGANTGSTLNVTASGNPAASKALIVANNTAGSPSGNLIDLQAGGVSKLAVDATGNITQAGGTSTTNTVNGQRISSAANFTGTVTAATSLLAPLVDVASAGTLSVGTGTATTIQIGNAALSTGTQAINIGNNATSGGTTNVVIGSSSPGAGATTVQAAGALTLTGGATSTWGVSSGNASLTVTANGNGTLNLNSGTSGTVSLGTNNVSSKTINIGSIGSIAQATTIHIADTSSTAVTQAITLGSISAAANTTTIQGGNGSGAVSVQAAPSGTISLGTTNANTINIGGTTSTLALGGTSSSVWTVTGGSGTTTLSFVAPTATNAIQFPDAGGTVCTTVASTCSGTYLTTLGTYLAKNASDTSSFAVTAANYLYTFTNSNATPTTGGVLSLDNGANTGSTLSVTASGNPAATKALIVANNTNGAPSGNLLDLQTGGVSKVSVSAAGALTVANGATSLTGASGGSATALTVNSGAASNVGLLVQGATNQSGDLVDVKNVSGGTTVLAINSAGVVTFAGVQPASVAGNGTAAGSVGFGLIVNGATGGNTSGTTGQVAGSGAALSLSGGAGGTAPAGSQNGGGGGVLISGGAAGAGAGSANFRGNVILQASGGFTGIGTLAPGNTLSVKGLTTGDAAAQVAIGTAATTGKGLVIQGVASQSASLLELQDSAGNINGAFSSGGNQLTLGRVAASGTVTQGKLLFSDGSTDNRSTTLQSATLTTGSQVITIPDTAGAGGTICLQTSTACGFIVNGTSQQTSSNFNISGTGTAGTSLLAPLHATADVASGTSGTLTLRSGNGTAGNASSGNVSLDVGSKNGSGFAGNINIGASNALNINVGHNAATASGTSISLQGLAATSNLIFNDTTNTNQTTITFTTPTAARSIVFPDAGGTVCTTTASTCSGTYQAAGSYLAKNAVDTSSFAVTSGYLYTMTNSSSGVASGVLKLDNGSNTSNGLFVTAASSPAAGNAVLFASDTLNNATGNLLDLWSTQSATAASRLSVDTAGNLLQAGGSSTTDTINGQRISSAASFTGTVTAATGLTVTAGGILVSAGGLNLNNSVGISNAGPISGVTTLSLSSTISGGTTYTASTSLVAPVHSTADVSAASTPSAAVTFRSGNATGTGGASGSGNVTVDSGLSTNGTAGQVSVGSTNSSQLNLGRAGAPTLIQGSASSSIQVNNGANFSAIQFTAPTAQVTYTLGTNGSNVGPVAICTALVASCNTTYQPYSATGYILKGAQDSSSATVAGNLLSLTNNSGAAAGVLALSNSGTNAALSVTAASNPTAGQAVILANNTTTGGQSGNLLDLQKNSVSSLAVDINGNITQNGGTSTTDTINGQRLSSAASFTGTVTSASTITASAGGINVSGTGTFNNGVNVTGAFAANGGASISTGLNNNSGGITNAGAVSGLTSLSFNTNGTIDTAAANSISIGTSTATGVTAGRAGGTLSLQGNGSSSWVVSSGTNNTTISFAAPSAAGTIYQFGNATAGTTYQICTSFASSCGTTYAAYYANGYVQLDPAAAQADATVNSTIWLNKNTADTSNLVRLQAAGSNVFTVQANGTMTSSGISYLGGTSASYAMQVDTANFKVRIGTGTPTLGSGGSNATAALYVSGTSEFANLVKIGDNTNNASFDGTTKELTFNGTARHTRRISLTPEYPGAVMTPNGSSNTGLMTSDFCSGTAHLSIPTSSNPCASTEEHNYYKWVSVNASAQTYDIYVRYLLPSDFSAFTADNSIFMYGYRTTTNDKVELSFVQNNGSLCGSATNVATTNTTWTEAAISAPLATTCAANISANQVVTLRIRMTSSGTTNQALAGEIRFDYLSKY